MTALALGVVLFGFAMGFLMYRHRGGMAGILSALAFALGGVVAGWFIYTTDRDMRAHTLFEVLGEGSLGAVVGEEAPRHTYEFTIEHPGVEHSLMVAPTATPTNIPGGPVELQFSLTDESGQVVVEDRGTYRLEGGGRQRRTQWEARHFPFTPPRVERYRLEVVILTAEIPAVHLRVEDPLKTDGHRIPGY